MRRHQSRNQARNQGVVKNYWLSRRSAPVKNGRPRRQDIPAGENLCFHCPAKCCHYIAQWIDKPTTWDGFDMVRWFLLHERTAVFVEDGEWYLLAYLTCNKLLPDGRCGIYPTRPKVCREYAAEACEFDENAVYDQLFELPEQLEEYAEAILGPRGERSIRSPRPARLQTNICIDQ